MARRSYHACSWGGSAGRQAGRLAGWWTRGVAQPWKLELHGNKVPPPSSLAATDKYLRRRVGSTHGTMAPEQDSAELAYHHQSSARSYVWWRGPIDVGDCSRPFDCGSAVCALRVRVRAVLVLRDACCVLRVDHLIYPSGMPGLRSDATWLCRIRSVLRQA